VPAEVAYSPHKIEEGQSILPCMLSGQTCQVMCTVQHCHSSHGEHDDYDGDEYQSFIYHLAQGTFLHADLGSGVDLLGKVGLWA
jgi:hypothetical protein